MKHTVYFLISPNSELVSRLRSLAGTDLSDLFQPIMWSGSEFDKTRLQHTDLDVLIKIFFLDTLLRERSSSNEFGKTFPEMTISASFFDAFWSLQRIQLDMSIEIAIEDSIESGTIHAIESTKNERVNELLDFYRSKKNVF